MLTFIRIPSNDHGMRRDPATNVVLCVSKNEQHRDLVASFSARTDDTDVFFAGTEVGEVASSCREVAPRVILFSRIPLITWFRVLPVLESVYAGSPLPKLVLISENIDSAYVYRVLSYGFDDIVDCQSANVSFDDSLRAALDPNDMACSPQLVEGVDLLGDFRSKPIVYADLVDYRIAGMVAAGYTDREIAEVVHYSYQVVRNRISAMLFRSGLRNRTHLAFRYLAEKLCEE